MKNFLNATLLLALIVLTASCTKNDNFSAGWDEKSIETSVTLDPQSPGDIVLGNLDILSNTAAYLDVNNHDLKSYQMLEVRPTFGSVVSTSLLPMGFVESLDVYALHEGAEVLIATISSGSSQDPSMSLSGIDVNVLDLSDDSVQILLRPEYNDLGSVADNIEVEVSLAFSYSLTGRK